MHQTAKTATVTATTITGYIHMYGEMTSSPASGCQLKNVIENIDLVPKGESWTRQMGRERIVGCGSETY